MPDVNKYLDEIDIARTRRAKDLSQIKFTCQAVKDFSLIGSRSAIVLTYANWEGFYNECARIYVCFLRETGKMIRESDWMLLLGAFHTNLEALKDRHHSDDARIEFIQNLKPLLDCGFDKFDIQTIAARSNLDFRRLSKIYALLGFDIGSMQKFRNRLDQELVKWRHSVAHGDAPDLSAVDIASHVDFDAELLITVADTFQAAIANRI